MRRHCSGGTIVPHSNCIDPQRTSEETLRALFSAAEDAAA